MGPAARPTDSERIAVRKAQIASRKPKFTKPKGAWTFSSVRALCEVANLKLSSDAEEEWDFQDELKVSPSCRTINLINGKTPRLSNIVSGATSGILATPAEKVARYAKSSATQKAREHKQKNWIEAAAINQFTTEFSAARPGYGFLPNPDGLGADFNMRHEGEEGCVWAAIQMKSAMANPREGVNLNVQKVQGEKDGQYENMILIAATVDPAVTHRPTAADGFNAVASTRLVDLFVYQSAADMPGASLQPCPRVADRPDAFGAHRWTAGVDTDEQREALYDLVITCFNNAKKYTLEQIWFGRELNRKVKQKHRTEMLNNKALKEAVGFDSFSAPWTQNETVDIVVCIGGVQVRISLKTATKDKRTKSSYEFKLGAAPHSDFCDVVMVFYISSAGVRTHVSVLCARRVYDVKRKTKKDTFCWSSTNKKDVLKTRISLSNAAEAAVLIQAAVEKIMKK